MNLRGITAVLLFASTIPIVMKYRIYPMEGTPYVLFGILFISLILYSIVSLYRSVVLSIIRKISTNQLEKIQRVLFFLIIAISLGGAVVTAIADRHRVAPQWGAHDIILQQEAAMRYLLQGKNPYKETYFGTPVELFQYDEQGEKAVNPALYHFVMPPVYLLFPFPFYWIANRMFGYFDGRMVLVVLQIVSIFFIYRLFKRKDFADVTTIIISLSPSVAEYFIEGRSDAFALSFLLGSLVFLQKKTVYISVILFTLALLTKQTMWFATPLYFAFLSILYDRNWKAILPGVGLMGAISIGIVGPFLLWDAKAFVDSVVLYLSAGGPTGYPVSGYGLSMILYSTGIIKNLHDYYPFHFWQFGFGIPTVVATVWFFLKKPLVSRFFIGFAMTLFVFWYTSRYFNNSHIAVVGILFSIGILKQYDEEHKETLASKNLVMKQ